MHLSLQNQFAFTKKKCLMICCYVLLSLNKNSIVINQGYILIFYIFEFLIMTNMFKILFIHISNKINNNRK